MSFLCVFFFFSVFFIENITGRLYNIQNSKLCFRDMKIMSLRNDGDFGKQLVLKLCHSGMMVILVNSSSCGLIIYRITTIPS